MSKKLNNVGKGSFLVAKPSSIGDFFNRTVILITEYGSNGAIGFALNKPLQNMVNEYLVDLNVDLLLYEGGPVETNNIYFLHNRPDIISNSLPVSNGLFWSGDFDDVLYGLNNGLLTKQNIRFFLGYSGWEKNQLKSEVKNMAWEVISGQEIDVFNDWNHNLWQQELSKIGGEHLLFLNSPENPEMN